MVEMFKKRYALVKRLPYLFLFVAGVLCIKNLYIGINRQGEDVLDSGFVPQKPLISNKEILRSNVTILKEDFNNMIPKPATVKQMDMKPSPNRDMQADVSPYSVKRNTKVKTKQLSNLSRTTCINTKCNFVFIKPMKCATETVVRILRKYSYDNDLNIMLPRKNRLYLAWPYLMDDSDYRLSDRPFNGLIDHAIYNKTIMNGYFPPHATQYITIIREPLKHFKSTFNYFKIAQIAGIFAKNPLMEYLENIDYYDSVYRSHEAGTHRYCIPDGFSVTKNLIAHCLGMPLGYPKGRPDISNNLPAVKRYIQNLDREFSLVMIVEHFHESLILFKRLMKWQLKDMIYKFVNRGTYFFSLNDHCKMKHRQWSSIDYMIYDHFNSTLWRKIAAEGPDFHDEVHQFSSIQNQVNHYCWGFGRNIKSKLQIGQSKFNSEFSISKQDCELMDDSWLIKIKAKFDKDNSHVIDPRPELKRKTC